MPYRGRHLWGQRIAMADMASCPWLPPSEVIEVAFLGWRRHGLLRDARFLDIRADTAAHAVQKKTSRRQSGGWR